MTDIAKDGTMRCLRLHSYGDPADVLRLEVAPIPTPGRGAIRIRVNACGLNPADWALCRGLFPKALPRGVGLDVAGVVDALGEGVTGVAIGDPVLGPANYSDHGSAGAAEYAIVDYWTPLPPGLGMASAASLPMVVETAYRCIDWLGVRAGQTVMISGGGSMIGFGAVQMALLRGARVVTTAGETFAGQLRAMGALVTPYGEGMVARVRDLVGTPDLIFDCAPTNLKQRLSGGTVESVLPDLIAIAGGDPARVLTCVDMAGAPGLGVRNGMNETPGGPDGAVLRYDKLGEFAALAAAGRFTVPLARTFAFEEWPEALELSMNGQARGKLVLAPAAATESEP